MGWPPTRPLESSPERLDAFPSEGPRSGEGVAAIALAVRLPRPAIKSDVLLELPFTHGQRGTVSAMPGATRRLVERVGKPTEEVTTGLVDGVGFIGSCLTESLNEEFGPVLAVDPRYGEASSEAGNVVYTEHAEDTAEAQVAMLLTARSSDMASSGRHLASGTLVARDTYPEMPEAVRDAIEQRGAVIP